MTKIFLFVKNPLFILVLLIVVLYYKFFIFGKIPIPADLLVGAYFPWLDYSFGYPTGVPVKNPLISDVFSQFFVWKYLAMDNFARGIFPLWNNYSFSGTPLLASYHSAILNPFNILLYLPKYWGWGFYIFFQTLLASIGIYLLMGMYLKNNSAKIIAALVFSLSGLMTTWIEFGTGVYAAAMMPWTLFSIEKYFKTLNFRYLFLFIFSLTVLYLSGHAQLTQYSTFIILLFLFFIKIQKKISFKKFIPIFICLILVLGLVSIQILPVLEFSKATIRNTDIPILGINHDGLNNLTDLIRFVVPDFYGNPVTYNYWGDGSYHEQASFLGVLTIPLILYLIFKKKKPKHIIFWIVIFLLSIFVTYKNPFTAWFYSLKIPLLTYSNASRTFFITSLAAGILAGFAIDFLSEEKNIKRKFLPLLLLITLIIFILTVAIYIFTNSSNLDLELQANLKISFRNLIFPLILLTAASISVILIKKRQILICTFVLLVFIDLGRYFLKYNPFVPQKIIFPKTAVIEFLQSNSNYRYARTDQVVFPPNSNIHYSLKSSEGYDAMLTEDYARFFNVVNGNPFNNPINRYVDLKNFKSPFVDALGIKYLLAVKRDEQGGIRGNILDYQIVETGYKIAYEDISTVVLENPNVKPTVYFAEGIKTRNDKKELIRELENKNFDPSKTALVLSSDLIKYDEKGIAIKDIQEEGNEIRFKTFADKDTFVIISNGYNSGWKGFIDNMPVKVYQTNLALMGLPVPKGEHDIVLKYYPYFFDIGWKISLSSLILVFVFVIYSVKKKLW